MKKLHAITVVLLLCATNAMSWFVGSHEIYMAADVENGDTSLLYPHFYNTAEALAKEREYCAAWIELAHHYLYENNPSSQEPREKYNYWLDIVMEGDEYALIDSLNDGDWEDFYSDWESPQQPPVDLRYEELSEE